MAETGKKRSTKSPEIEVSSRGVVRKKDNGLKNDIIILCVLAFCVLLLLSNFGLCGIAGAGLRTLFFGLFGIIEYVLPILLFIFFLFIIANKGRKMFVVKLISIIGILCVLCMFFQLLMFGYTENTGLLSYFWDSAADHMGGGLVGGLLVSLFGKLLGTVGSYVLMIALLIVFLILLTQKPLISKAKDRSTAAIDEHRERREIKREKKEHEQQLYAGRRERVRKGVQTINFDKDEADNTTSAERFTSFLHNTGDESAVIEAAPEEKEQAPRRKRSSKAAQTEKDNSVIKEEVVPSGAMSSVNPNYKYPPLSLLRTGGNNINVNMDAQVRATALKLEETLNNFGVHVTVVNATSGPTVTRYEVQPEQGVKVSRILNLANDIKLNLAAEDIRIEAPIPGKAAVGIEVPNKTNNSVMLGDLLSTQEFRNFKSKLAFAVGKDLAGRTVVSDISKMPHLLIAGATGSGKSVCLNSLIVSILYKATPDEVRIIMIDPKVVELSMYNNIPHLLIPVVTDAKKAAGALNWAVAEMSDRYNKFAEFSVRDIDSYNAKIDRIADTANDQEEKPVRMPKIIIIVDELADLMMVSPAEVEDAIVRLTQLARAAGIHLIVATQRPSVNVITGLIKANMPSRIALSVASGTDSRVIIDMNGAEKLLGKGDMLFYPAGYQKPARVQGAFVSDDEIAKVVDFLASNKSESIEYDMEIQSRIDSSAQAPAAAAPSDDRDVYFAEAGKFIIEKDKASIGMLQRVFKIGFNRAARIMDQLCDAGVVGEEEGTKPRKILMTMEEFENYLEEN